MEIEKWNNNEAFEKWNNSKAFEKWNNNDNIFLEIGGIKLDFRWHRVLKEKLVDQVIETEKNYF